MRPIVINSDGRFQRSHGAIRVGTAVQPYHAVPLAQVKKMLSILTVVSSVFRVQDEWTVSDRAVGFCLSEPGIQEPLDYVYTGRIVDKTRFITDKAITPPAKQVVRDAVTTVDVFNPFTLSEPNYTTGEQWDYVYTGKFIDEIALKDVPITTSSVKTSESITLLSASLSYTLTETGWSDGNLDYVYTGTGVDTTYIEDAFLPSVKMIITDVTMLSDNDNSDLVFVAVPEEPAAYPGTGLVLQKIKPTLPGDTRALGDKAIIKPKYKVTDKQSIKDTALGCCLSDVFVPEPFERMLFAKVADKVTAGSQPAKSTLEVV
jgi:hypothetical protein